MLYYAENVYLRVRVFVHVGSKQGSINSKWGEHSCYLLFNIRKPVLKLDKQEVDIKPF